MGRHPVIHHGTVRLPPHPPQAVHHSERTPESGLRICPDECIGLGPRSAAGVRSHPEMLLLSGDRWRYRLDPWVVSVP